MKLIIKRDSKVVGFITWNNIGKPKHKLVELTRIEVDKKYRKQGIATKLFQGMLKRIKFRKLFLMTHESNKVSRKFYLKMGMGLETRLSDHYYKGEDELVYSMFRK